jgi:hypothetical protein
MTCTDCAALKKIASPNHWARLLELQQSYNATRRRKLCVHGVAEWTTLRQYNRARAVKRHSMSLKNKELEVSPLEERENRGIDDE